MYLSSSLKELTHMKLHKTSRCVLCNKTNHTGMADSGDYVPNLKFKTYRGDTYCVECAGIIRDTLYEMNEWDKNE